MFTVAIISQKGGAGKTTLALNLAVAAECAGQAALLVDLDPQGSASAWAQSRDAATPVVTAIQAHALPSTLDRAQQAAARLVPARHGAAGRASCARGRPGCRPCPDSVPAVDPRPPRDHSLRGHRDDRRGIRGRCPERRPAPGITGRRRRGGTPRARHQSGTNAHWAARRLRPRGYRKPWRSRPAAWRQSRGRNRSPLRLAAKATAPQALTRRRAMPGQGGGRVASSTHSNTVSTIMQALMPSRPTGSRNGRESAMRAGTVTMRFCACRGCN